MRVTRLRLVERPGVYASFKLGSVELGWVPEPDGFAIAVEFVGNELACIAI